MLQVVSSLQHVRLKSYMLVTPYMLHGTSCLLRWFDRFDDGWWMVEL